MQLIMLKEIDLRIMSRGHTPYKQGCECTPFSGSIDTLIGMNNEEICWEMKSSKKKKKINFNKRKEFQSTRGKKVTIFKRLCNKRREKEMLSHIVMLSEVLSISHKIDVKWLYN